MANFCTLNPNYYNPVRSNKPSLSEGNLYAYGVADAMSEGTLASTTGKFYYEALTKGDTMFGFGIPGKWGGDNPGANDKAIALHANGQIQCGGVIATSGVSFNDGNPHTVMVAYDHEANKVWFGVDGTWGQSGDPANGTGGQAIPSSLHGFPWIPAFRITNSTTDFSRVNFGQLPFRYTPPSGFVALSTENLPEPPISNLAAEKPEDHFNTVLYTGNGGTQAVSCGFEPDFVWIKSRSGAYNHQLYDVIRGDNNALRTNSTNAESLLNVSLDADGFTLGDGSNNINGSGVTYVAWCWKAGGAAVSNTDGSITSQVSANTDAGFSIVSYTSPNSASNQTVGHGLDQAPEFLIVKNRDNTYNWDIWHKDLTGNNYGLIFNTNAQSENRWSSTAPTDSVFTTINNFQHISTNDYIAYCWHSVEGYSSFGSYIGNGSSDGSFVYTGFRPAFVMVKRTDSIGNWAMYDENRDVDNPIQHTLWADLSDNELSPYDRVDLLSNGFKLRDTGSGVNNSGGTFIYMAFAESPFKYSSAR